MQICEVTAYISRHDIFLLPSLAPSDYRGTYIVKYERKRRHRRVTQEALYEEAWQFRNLLRNHAHICGEIAHLFKHKAYDTSCKPKDI